MGTIPDFTQESGGVTLTGVRPGSPAEQAGIQAGDVLVGMGEKEIQNLYDFTYALRAHKPGDEVEVRYRRGEETFAVNVTLGKRP